MIIFDGIGNVLHYNGPKKDYSFAITEEKAIEIAKEAGINYIKDAFIENIYSLAPKEGRLPVAGNEKKPIIIDSYVWMVTGSEMPPETFGSGSSGSANASTVTKGPSGGTATSSTGTVTPQSGTSNFLQGQITYIDVDTGKVLAFQTSNGIMTNLRNKVGASDTKTEKPKQPELRENQKKPVKHRNFVSRIIAWFSRWF